MEVRGRIRIGRSLDCELSIDSDRASREHAEAEPFAGGLRITDLGSRNGTYIDGVRLGASPQVAAPGAVLRIGTLLLLVVEDIDVFLTERPMPGPPLVGGARTARLCRRLRDVAGSKVPLLLEGETGTGKDQAARYVHEQSGRTGALVAVNCAAIPAELIESELFGHVRGAFSGASAPRVGLLRSADRGTLLLDEAGDLPLVAQAKLLRVLEDAAVRPVGQDTSVAVDVRFVAATNRPLASMVEEDRFRGDLYHRLAASTIMLPPLRHRVEDVPLLAQYFVRQATVSWTATAMERCVLSLWPGNVRQLRNVVETIASRVHRDGRDTIGEEDLVELGGSDRGGAEPADAGAGVERAQLETALRMERGNVLRVSRKLGISRGTLYDAFKRLGIDPSEYRRGG